MEFWAAGWFLAFSVYGSASSYYSADYLLYPLVLHQTLEI